MVRSYIRNMRFLLGVIMAGAAMGASVKEDHAPLRTGCYADSDIKAKLPAGTPLTIRYSLAGEDTTCYKVAVESAGKTIEGYLPAHAIQGIEEFDKARRDASWLDMSQVMSTVRNSAGIPSAGKASSGGPRVAARAAELIEASQPGKALELLEPELRTSPKDPGLLMLAGVASWRNDDPQKALQYWRASLDRQPNADLQRLYAKVEKEAHHDQSGERIYGLRVLLRYDSSVINAVTTES